MSTTAGSAVRIFLSYSHKDQRQKEKIVECLQALQRGGIAEIWSDERISLGTQWDDEIRNRIEQSDLALVLVSTEFLNSPYCRRVEIAKFLELRRERGLRIVPVILFESDWKNEPWLAATQAYPGGDKTLFGNHKGRAAMARALQGLVDRLRIAIKESVDQRRTPPAPAVAPSIPRSEVPQETLIAQLFDRDPVVNSAAADEWIARGLRDFRALADKLPTVQPLNIVSVQRVFASDAQASGSVLQECVFSADVDWHRARGAADSFSVAHRNVSGAAVVGRLDDTVHFDIGRLCISALGQMVASGWGTEILRCLRGPEQNVGNLFTNSYTFDKYNVYCIETLAKFVSGASDSHDTFYALTRLAEAIEFADGYSKIAETNRDHAVREVLVTCSVVHADEIIRRWSAHANPKLRAFAAYALGQMRLARAVGELVRMLGDTNAVAEEAAMALGNIGTDAAVGALLGRRQRGFAIALALPGITDRDTCLVLTREFLASEVAVNERWLAIRTAGLRGLTELRELVAEQLHSRDSVDRGCAAIALVRLGDEKRLPQIRRAFNEAGDSRERALMTLAVIDLRTNLSEEAKERFRSDLCDCARFMRPIREDILQIMEESGAPDLEQIARAWRPVYARQGDY